MEKENTIHISISRLYNLFFFISNLSEWSQYCRTSYNKIWLDKNPLLQEEKNALVSIVEILKKYPLNSLFASFETDDFVWNTVKNSIDEESCTTLQSVFSLLSPRFEKIWNTHERHLLQIKNETLQVISEKSFRDASDMLQILYASKSSHALHIFLLMSPISKRLVNGGGGIRENTISIECSVPSLENNTYHELSRVILHEVTHVSFENDLKKKIETFVSKESFKKEYENFFASSPIYTRVKSFPGIIKEMIAVSLVPEGYIGEHFFAYPTKKNILLRKCIQEKKLEKNYYDLMLFSIWELRSFAKKYVSEKKPIDSKYIQKAFEVWKKFESIDLKTYEIK